MCGRYALISSEKKIADYFGLGEYLPVSSQFQVTPRFNIAPTTPVLAVRAEGDPPRRVPVMLKWGLVPSWAKDSSVGNHMINARVESAAEKPGYKAAIRRRRCLLPADAFYFWQTVGKRKQPHAFRLKNEKPMGLAGIWEDWEGQNGSVLQTCAVLTTEANELITPMHERMPLLIARENFDEWLDPKNEDGAAICLKFGKPYPAREMKAFPVSPLVNRPGIEDPRCLEPVAASVDPEQESFF